MSSSGSAKCKVSSLTDNLRLRGGSRFLAFAVGALLAILGGVAAAAAANDPASIQGLTSKFVDVNGVRTRYYEMGQGEPMVLVHGGSTAGSSTANVWSRNIPGLAKHFHIFAVDRLGSGMTDNPLEDKDYSTQSQVEHIYQFIQTLKLGQVHLVGHSAGGGIVFFLAILHPEIVRTLTVVAHGPEAPSADPNGGPTKLEAELKKCPDQTQYAGLKCRVVELAWLPTTFDDQYWAADVYMATLPKSKQARDKINAGAGEAERKAFPAWRATLWDKVRKDGVLQVPVLLYAGKNDVLDWAAGDATAKLSGELGLFDIIAAKNTRVRMIVQNNGGHFMYREYPEQFNQDLLGFIDYFEHHTDVPPQGQLQLPK
ncbi:MAG: alpha/beta hydrolase [Acidobacteriia bacterium]|nr:alpha/beta hydrolase [Terriglobia bacterium]